jgi:hypothetical protein
VTAAIWLANVAMVASDLTRRVPHQAGDFGSETLCNLHTVTSGKALQQRATNATALLSSHDWT